MCKAAIQTDMFDFNGEDKLAMESVEAREAIVKHYAKDPHCLFAVSTSGGSDSQMMAIAIENMVPKEQIIYVHANLGVVEHPGILDHIKRFKPKGVPLHVVQAKHNFIDMVLKRSMFPNPAFRECTSGLKTQEIDKLYRKVMRERGAHTLFNCVGLRSSESIPRSKRSPMFVNKRLTKKDGTRNVYDFFPIFHLSKQETFQGIYDAGQEPFHVYGFDLVDGVATKVRQGNHRVSCQACIMGSANDLHNASVWYPDSFACIVALELVTGHSMFHRKVKGESVKVSVSEKAKASVDQIAVMRWKNKLLARREVLLEEKRLALEAKALKKAEKENASTAKYIDRRTISMF